MRVDEVESLVQEEGLGCGQLPVPGCELLGGDVRAGDAERDDLTGQQRENETPRPKTEETAPRALIEGIEGGIIDRRPSDYSIIIRERRWGRVNRGFFIVDDVRFGSDVGHRWSLVAKQWTQRERRTE